MNTQNKRQMKTWLSTCIALCVSLSLMAQINPPNLVCITTLFNGDVELTWEIPTNTCGTTFNGYRIYVSADPTQPFALLTMVTNPAQTTFTHTNANGNSLTWYYYMTTDLICPNEVPGQSLTLNNQPPAITEMEYVTVNDAGNVEIHWLPNTSPQTDAYIIFWETPTGFVAIDTVFGRTNTVYEHLDAAPATSQETYTIIAMDKCGNSGLVNNDPHSTILLNSAIDRCTREVTLNWTPYTSWTAGVQTHQIWLSKNGAPFQFIDYIGDTTQYIYRYAEDGEQLEFKIYAVKRNTSVRSGSNTVRINADIVAPMQFIYLKNVTVDANNHVQIDWRWDTNADIASYTLNRVDSTSFVFSPIHTENAVYPLQNALTYQDTSINAATQQYFYNVSSLDSCDNLVVSNFGSTIFLSGYARQDFKNILEWTPFLINNATVEEYTIYKIIDGIETPLTTLSFFEDTYEDELNAYDDAEGNSCYFIIARALMEYPDGTSEVIYSRSNIFCISQPALLRVPNAFVPSGENNFFKPLIVFGEAAQFRMVIFSRWGEKIFETTDAARGWDGLINHSRPARQGIYVYKISVTKTDGTVTEKEGTVMLVR